MAKLSIVNYFESKIEAEQEKNRLETLGGSYVIKARKPTKKFPYGRWDVFRSKEDWEA
jgi:hypothetical protein